MQWRDNATHLGHCRGCKFSTHYQRWVVGAGKSDRTGQDMQKALSSINRPSTLDHRAERVAYLRSKSPS